MISSLKQLKNRSFCCVGATGFEPTPPAPKAERINILQTDNQHFRNIWPEICARFAHFCTRGGGSWVFGFYLLLYSPKGLYWKNRSNSTII